MSTVHGFKDTLLFSAEGNELALPLSDSPLKVSELVAMLKHDVEHKHHHVRVVGEIASFKPWHSGHWYFDIKDEKALIPAVMFKPHAARVPFKVKDGQEILFVGKISVYQANARLQMVVEGMEPLGQGALALAFLQLKERLLQEGLFDQSHKKSLKVLNRTIGIVTSSHGAALRDMIKIIKARLPKSNILFAPVRVQGVGAKEEIVSALRLLDHQQQCDVILVGRGGGSLEDLWAFNEELVARAIYEAKTPIISAVGHETDTTISDFVADVRAATPTHGAMLAAANLLDLEGELKESLKTLKAVLKKRLSDAKICLIEHKENLADPRILLFRHWQSLDELQGLLQKAFARAFKAKKMVLESQSLRLKNLAPWRSLRGKKEALFALKTALYQRNPQTSLKLVSLELKAALDKLHEIFRSKLSLRREALSMALGKLEALSPLSVLKRGFSLVSNKSGRLLTAHQHINVNDTISIRLHDGVISAIVTDKE